MFDATFLCSSWMCIFGQGCQGVLDQDATDLVQGCCSYGAHFADGGDRKRVRGAATRLRGDQWQFKGEAKALGSPLMRDDEGDWVSALVDDACIFLNRPGFPAG